MTPFGPKAMDVFKLNRQQHPDAHHAAVANAVDRRMLGLRLREGGKVRDRCLVRPLLVVAHAEKRAVDPVLVGESAQLVQHGLFATLSRKIQRTAELYVARHRRVASRLQ